MRSIWHCFARHGLQVLIPWRPLSCCEHSQKAHTVCTWYHKYTHMWVWSRLLTVVNKDTCVHAPAAGGCADPARRGAARRGALLRHENGVVTRHPVRTGGSRHQLGCNLLLHPYGDYGCWYVPCQCVRRASSGRNPAWRRVVVLPCKQLHNSRGPTLCDGHPFYGWVMHAGICCWQQMGPGWWSCALRTGASWPQSMGWSRSSSMCRQCAGHGTVTTCSPVSQTLALVLYFVEA